MNSDKNAAEHELPAMADYVRRNQAIVEELKARCNKKDPSMVLELSLASKITADVLHDIINSISSCGGTAITTINGEDLIYHCEEMLRSIAECNQILRNISVSPDSGASAAIIPNMNPEQDRINETMRSCKKHRFLDECVQDCRKWINVIMNKCEQCQRDGDRTMVPKITKFAENAKDGVNHLQQQIRYFREERIKSFGSTMRIVVDGEDGPCAYQELINQCQEMLRLIAECEVLLCDI